MTLTKLRRYIIERATREGISLSLDKVLDVEERGDVAQGLRVHQ